MLFYSILIFGYIHEALSLNNGLALKPPMGWMSWERFRCNIDCKNDPENCISENLYITMADLMVKYGYSAAGYEYVNIDDCWMSKERDKNGRLVADPNRFPMGIKNLTSYVHSKNLKLGIYEDIGYLTCGLYPGSEGFEKIDAQTFADWEIDYLKLDGCFKDPAQFPIAFPLFSLALNRTGRPIVFSCEWPIYLPHNDTFRRNYSEIRKYCNSWRNYDDVEDSWQSVLAIVDYMASMQDYLIPTGGPGGWHDPDMLIIGDFNLHVEQSKSQMALWSIMASPLFMSNDLRSIRSELREILLNEDVIAVDQDSLGIMGKRIINGSEMNGVEVWRRPINPVFKEQTSYAFVFFNRKNDTMPTNITTQLNKLGITTSMYFNVTELFTKKQYGKLQPSDNLTFNVNPLGVIMLKCQIT